MAVVQSFVLWGSVHDAEVKPPVARILFVGHVPKLTKIVERVALTLEQADEALRGNGSMQ